MPLISVKQGALEYRTAPNISTPHCFTTRHGGVSKGSLASTNLNCHRGDDDANVAENYRILADALCFRVENLVMTRQTHSDIVQVVTAADHMGIDHHAYPEADGLITCTPGTALAVFTADCTPILLHDPVTGAVGAVHAGWRGTAADIAGKAVRAMQAGFGTKPENIRAAIGPNIGPCCFATDADVPQAMIAVLGSVAEKWIDYRNSKYYVNLKAINARFLQNAGVMDIEISTECTMCSPENYWSHRYTGGVRGAQGAIIVCKEGTP